MFINKTTHLILKNHDNINIVYSSNTNFKSYSFKTTTKPKIIKKSNVTIIDFSNVDEPVGITINPNKISKTYMIDLKGKVSTQNFKFNKIYLNILNSDLEFKDTFFNDIEIISKSNKISLKNTFFQSLSLNDKNSVFNGTDFFAYDLSLSFENTDFNIKDNLVINLLNICNFSRTEKRYINVVNSFSNDSFTAFGNIELSLSMKCQRDSYDALKHDIEHTNYNHRLDLIPEIKNNLYYEISNDNQYLYNLLKDYNAIHIQSNYYLNDEKEKIVENKNDEKNKDPHLFLKNFLSIIDSENAIDKISNFDKNFYEDIFKQFDDYQFSSKDFNKLQTKNISIICLNFDLDNPLIEKEKKEANISF